VGYPPQLVRQHEAPTRVGKIPNDFIPSFAFQLGDFFQLGGVNPEEDVYASNPESVDFLPCIRVLREAFFFRIVCCGRYVLWRKMLKLRRRVDRQSVCERKVSLPDQEDLIRRSKWNRHRPLLPSLLLDSLDLLARLCGLSNLGFLLES